MDIVFGVGENHYGNLGTQLICMSFVVHVESDSVQLYRKAKDEWKQDENGDSGSQWIQHLFNENVLLFVQR